jgi:hypothetical protein
MRRFGLQFVPIGLVALVVGCAGGASSLPSPQASRPSSRTLVRNSELSGVPCTPELVGARPQSHCPTADFGVKLTHCRGPGAADIEVSGISCGKALGVEGVLEARWIASDPCKASSRAPSCLTLRQAVYTPWVVNRRSPPLKPTKAIGWTCWAGFDPEGSQGIEHVCWRGSSVLLFEIF